MAIFNSYVSLPEGNFPIQTSIYFGDLTRCHGPARPTSQVSMQLQQGRARQHGTHEVLWHDAHLAMNTNMQYLYV